MVAIQTAMHVMLLMATRPNKPLERTGSARRSAPIRWATKVADSSR